MEDIKVVVWAVDDDKMWLTILKEFLKKHGVDLLIFDRHQDFFEQLIQVNGEVDIVLMDVVMPEYDVREGLKTIYAINNRIKVILMTASIDFKELMSLVNGNGIFRFVEKGGTRDENNRISYMGKLMDFNCFEAIRIFIDEAKEHLLLTQPIHEQLRR